MEAFKKRWPTRAFDTETQASAAVDDWLKATSGSRGIVRRGTVVAHPEWTRVEGADGLLVLETAERGIWVITKSSRGYYWVNNVDDTRTLTRTNDAVHAKDLKAFCDLRPNLEGFHSEFSAMLAVDEWLDSTSGSRGIVRGSRPRWTPKDGDRVAVYSIKPPLANGRPRYGIVRMVDNRGGYHLSRAPDVPNGRRESRVGEVTFGVEFTPGGGMSWHTIEEDIRPVKSKSGSRGVVRRGRSVPGDWDRLSGNRTVSGWDIQLYLDAESHPLRIWVTTPEGGAVGGFLFNQVRGDWEWDANPEIDVPHEVKDAAREMLDWADQEYRGSRGVVRRGTVLPTASRFKVLEVPRFNDETRRRWAYVILDLDTGFPVRLETGVVLAEFRREWADGKLKGFLSGAVKPGPMKPLLPEEFWVRRNAHYDRACEK